MRLGRVYFMRPVGADGPVKIGFSFAPEQRLYAYASWSPYPLEIAAMVPGTISTESQFHALFDAHHSHHEWFHAAPEISAVIDAIKAETFDMDSLPGVAGSIRSKRAVAVHARRKTA